MLYVYYYPILTQPVTGWGIKQSLPAPAARESVNFMVLRIGLLGQYLGRDMQATNRRPQEKSYIHETKEREKTSHTHLSFPFSLVFFLNPSELRLDVPGSARVQKQ